MEADHAEGLEGGPGGGAEVLVFEEKRPAAEDAAGACQPKPARQRSQTKVADRTIRGGSSRLRGRQRARGDCEIRWRKDAAGEAVGCDRIVPVSAAASAPPYPLDRPSALRQSQRRRSSSLSRVLPQVGMFGQQPLHLSDVLGAQLPSLYRYHACHGSQNTASRHFEFSRKANQVSNHTLGAFC